MSITPACVFILKAELGKGKSTYCGLSFNWSINFMMPALLMDEDDPANREHRGSNHHCDSFNIIYRLRFHPILSTESMMVFNAL